MKIKLKILPCSSAGSSTWLLIKVSWVRSPPGQPKGNSAFSQNGLVLTYLKSVISWKLQVRETFLYVRVVYIVFLLDFTLKSLIGINNRKEDDNLHWFGPIDKRPKSPAFHAGVAGSNPAGITRDFILGLFTSSCSLNCENAWVAIKKHLSGVHRWSFDGCVKA